MGREIRRVPKQWAHPVDARGRYVSLGECKYFHSNAESWVIEMREWFEEWEENKEEEIDPPECPELDRYMPTGDWFQLFEDVSEGTPISPPFESEEELISWLSENKDFWGCQWSKEAAADIVSSGYALSGIMSKGRIYKPEEQYMLKN